MRPIIAPLVGLLFSAAMLAPSLFVLDFVVHKAYIERELCVQRDVVEGMRTCHGQCQLSKKFRALEREAEAGFPTERIQVRQEPMVQYTSEDVVLIRVSEECRFCESSFALASGYSVVSEPVPWC